MTYPLNSRLRRRRRATKVPQQRKEPVLLSSGSPRWSFSSCSASPNSCHSIYFQYDGLFKAMTNSISLCQYFVFKDLNELELPKTCKTEFPDVDDLLNFKLIIYPDEVRKIGCLYQIYLVRLIFSFLGILQGRRLHLCIQNRIRISSWAAQGEFNLTKAIPW